MAGCTMVEAALVPSMDRGGLRRRRVRVRTDVEWETRSEEDVDVR
jgi:hypothetical protein